MTLMVRTQTGNTGKKHDAIDQQDPPLLSEIER